MHQTLQLTAALGFMAFLAWLWFRRAQATADLQRLHLEGWNRTLERFDTPQALVEFLSTEAGRSLLAPPVPLGGASTKQAHEGLRLIQSGLVALFVGLGFRLTFYLAMDWRAAGVRMNEIDAFGQALRLWQWSQISAWTGVALILGGLLAAFLVRRDRKRDDRD